jgi:eukaryotic translation initiation factor 2C
MGLSDSAIQSLTHKLCYTYVRATLGVSYAPPAYYADRLCERGRCYLRPWFAPDRNSDHYLSYLEQKTAIEKTHKDKLKLKLAWLKKPALHNGHRMPRKLQQQADLERESRDETTEAVERYVLDQAKAYWEGKRKGGPGPWHESLDDTMFWM